MIVMLTAAKTENCCGQSDHSIELIDRAILSFMTQAGATAATVAVSRDGHLLYTRGYGHSDSRQKVPTKPTAVIRIASATKPITAAICRELIAENKLSETDQVVELLGIEPHGGTLGDPRLQEITIAHLLAHTSGWNREETFNPMYDLSKIRRGLGIRRDVTKKDIVRYMWSQPLQADPGSEYQYSNFGYMLLGMVIEKVSGESYSTVVNERIADPLGVDDLAVSPKVARHRSPKEVHYEIENRLDMSLRDSSSGLATSAPTLCKFMDRYWLDGSPRNDSRNMFFYQYGTHPHTTSAILVQRLDDLNFAILINSRREESYAADNESFRIQFDEVLDEVQFR